MSDKRGKNSVMVFGSFDLLHLGHLHFFKQAKRSGKRLVVVVARDSTIKRVKGHEPFFSEKERLEIVSGLSVVDKAVLGGKRDKYAVIKRFKPSVIVLGFDQRANEKELKRKLKEMRLNTRVKRLRKGFKSRKHKSSLLKKVLLELSKELM